MTQRREPFRARAEKQKRPKRRHCSRCGLKFRPLKDEYEFCPGCYVPGDLYAERIAIQNRRA